MHMIVWRTENDKMKIQGYTILYYILKCFFTHEVCLAAVCLRGIRRSVRTQSLLYYKDFVIPCKPRIVGLCLICIQDSR